MDDVPEMVMKVAMAIEAELRRDPHLPTVAYAAINAMRKPTEAMLVAGLIPCRNGRYRIADGEANKVWPRMIDAALASPTKE